MYQTRRFDIHLSTGQAKVFEGSAKAGQKDRVSQLRDQFVDLKMLMIANIKVRLRESLAQLKYFPQTLNLIWAANRKLTIIWGILLIIQGLLPAGTVWLTRLLVDGLAAAIGTGVSVENMRPVAYLAFLMGGIIALTSMLQGVMTWVRTAQSERTADYLSELIHRQMIRIDLSFYERPKYLDRLHQVSHDMKNRPLALLENMGGLIQSGITLLAMGAILLPYGIWLPFLLLGSTLPAFYVLLRTNRQFHSWWVHSTTDRRWGDYYDSVLTEDVYAAELRLFEFGPTFKQAYQHLRSTLRKEKLDLIKRQGLARLWASVLGLVVSGGTMAWMVWRAFLGQVTLGDLALFYQIFNKGQTLLTSFLTNMGNVFSSTLFLSKLFEFLDLKPQITDPEEPGPPPHRLKYGIQFSNVTFRYPGSKKAALENFTCSFPAGKTVALVGANGAGKTTLMKLLCRFYDPESGSIKIDGKNIKKFSVANLRRMITAIFQFSLVHVATAAENIAIGDVKTKKSHSELVTAAKQAGAHEFIEKLPNGYDTLLNKYFPNGVNISGGEQQRLSLARAYVRNSPIMILDEPTSLMDSWGVIDWFDRFRKLASRRVSIIITHSLTIAKNADLIYVMDSGKIIEAGSHSQLLSKNGRYSKAWHAQFTPQPELVNLDSNSTQTKKVFQKVNLKIMTSF
jgi:ATP-binding cassette subfamily B protein